MAARNLFRLILLILPALAGAAGSAAPARSLRWPLDLPTRYLTSSFMEPRPGRYHAGLDLKTQSRTGFAVHAVEDGWISRVRAENGAYGRAVYVQGVSGRTTVYAHLSRFSDRILALVGRQRGRRAASTGCACSWSRSACRSRPARCWASAARAAPPARTCTSRCATRPSGR